MTPHTPIPQDVSLLPVFRALVETHQQAVRVATRYQEAVGLTPSQFDVLVTLGDTEGMTCKALSARSLVTGGTLTPVLDRMEAKGLVQRAKGLQDSRQTIVRLTAEGQALYETTFPPFITQMRAHIDGLSADEQAQLVKLLNKLKDVMH